MMGKLKSLGVVLAAVLALGAVVSSAAVADFLESEGSQEVTLTGAQEESAKFIFKTTAGSNTCPTATAHAQSQSGVTTVTTSEPKFPATGCLCIGIACTVTTNECHFLYHISGTAGTVDLSCPENKELTLDTTKCIIRVPPQSGLSTVNYENIGSAATREITIKFDITNIKYSHTKVGEGIGSCTTGSGTTGSFTGSAIVTAEKVSPGTGHVGIFVS